ncbi:DUF3576 domain-containing protein [Magnetospira sp. QH-2]|uniref:DUF3576 domain-containing protein n=1 Tax=Magnetospira sp. (strain QH-2) TaxID=1288970 RepID=UPI0003E8191B|nr:DUF3576 domain-containing protein [Magnetospira sp. QH-2]CCQ75603.1 conserved protein of unknown function [Magnetospira sp. QH-2]
MTYKIKCLDFHVAGSCQKRFGAWMGAVLVLAVLSGCSGVTPGEEVTLEKKESDSVFGEGGLTLFGDDQKKEQETGGIGVNGFLWRASLDTLDFMPLSSADPFGGVILTDWYSPQEAPNERFKMQVYILSRALRADGVKVSVFRQVRVGSSWRDASLPKATPTDMENAILLRARQMRRAATQ